MLMFTFNMSFNPVIELANLKINIGPPDDSTFGCNYSNPSDIVSCSGRNIAAQWSTSIGLEKGKVGHWLVSSIMATTFILKLLVDPTHCLLLSPVCLLILNYLFVNQNIVLFLLCGCVF